MGGLFRIDDDAIRDQARLLCGADSGRRGKSRGGSLPATCSNQAPSWFQSGWFHQGPSGDPGPLLLIVQVITRVPSSPGHREESEDIHTAHAGQRLLVGLPAKDCSCYSYDGDGLALGYPWKPGFTTLKFPKGHC